MKNKNFKVKDSGINFKVRAKNIYFWIGMIGVVLASVNVDIKTLTTWQMLFETLKNIANNPFQIACIIMAILGVINDHTTPGFSDTKRVLTYIRPGESVFDMKNRNKD